MNIRIISGNWKMNSSKVDIENWFKDFFEKAKDFKNSKNKGDILICVPSVYISYAMEINKKYGSVNGFKILIGAEDCHYENKGAFTGNVSPIMLKEFGVEYVIVGHSERRQYENESDEVVAKKASNALNNGLIPLVCVGESLEIRENKKHLEFIEKQVLNSTTGLDINKIIIAYEPVWAIGTGKVPTLDEIEEINAHIKKVLADRNNVKESDVNVLYGGSVKSSNAKEITALSSVNGVLVGGASLKGEEFFNIVTNSL